METMKAIIGTGHLSARQYNIIEERDVRVRMSDGIDIDLDLFRPDAEGKFPALLGISPFDKEVQSERIWPAGVTTRFVRGMSNAIFEAGPVDFFVRRGYVRLICSARGTGKSGGVYSCLDRGEVRDIYELVEWVAAQPWCNGNVGMMGVSYFAWNQMMAASLQPPHLKAIFPIFGATDWYRDMCWHGGICNSQFLSILIHELRVNAQRIQAQEELGEKGFKEAIAKALEDVDIRQRETLVKALENPDKKGNVFVIDAILHPTDGPYYRERSADYDTIRIPAYVGACWAIYPLHLPGAFRNWEKLKVAPKKMVIGPPYYLDRPFYQYQYEMLRWFDYWLKGIDTGIMEEPAVKVFVMGTGEWKMADDWPLPGTRWIPFNLHRDGILCEIEPWPDGGSDSFEDSPTKRGSLKYFSPPLVENTEVIGPIALNLYASTTANDVNFFVSLWDVDPEGKETILTRGWLKGSHREVDPEQSQPWKPFHTHTNPQPLTPGKIYEFNIEIIPTGNLFKVGHRIGLKISGVDDEEPKTGLEINQLKHVWSQTPKTVTVYHDAEYPSHLLLPITKGNIVGTFISGGAISLGKEQIEIGRA